MHKLKWNFNRNPNIFIQENAFEIVVCEMVAILSLPQCVNPSSACPVLYVCNTLDPNLVITVPADVLAPNGPKPSADKLLHTKLNIVS